MESSDSSGLSPKNAEEVKRKPNKKKKEIKEPMVGSRKSKRNPPPRDFYGDPLLTDGSQFTELLAVADEYPDPDPDPRKKDPIEEDKDNDKKNKDGDEKDKDKDVVVVVQNKNKRKRGLLDETSSEKEDKSGGEDKRSFPDHEYQDGDGDCEEEEKKDDKENKEKKSKTFSMVPTIALKDMKVGDYFSQTHYGKVTGIFLNGTLERSRAHFTYRGLRGPKEKDDWTVETPEAFAAASSRHTDRTVSSTRTELAKRLMACKDDVFTVKYKPVLSKELLGEKLLSLKNDVATCVSDADAKRVAKKMMDSDTKTLTGRLITANTELGYSLVDDLGGSPDDKTKLTRYRNVNHRDIVELIHRGVCYKVKSR